MRVMIIGANADRSRFSNKAIRAYLKHKHEVLAVHPTETSVEGLQIYPDPGSAPGPIDRVALYVGPRHLPPVLLALKDRGDVGEVYFNPGTDDPEMLKLARELGLRAVRGCAIVALGESPSSFPG